MMVDNYVLQRDLNGSIRLDAQHLLWKLYTGYTLNPAINRSRDMKIAEIGTGTGIWLLDLASQLPESAQLDGFDLSEQLFPPQHNWPVNITFNKLDAFGNVPDHLAHKYDMVHLRLWCSIVRNNDPARLIRHAAGLLKPGGYIQWEDTNLGNLVQGGEITERFTQEAVSRLGAQGLCFDWLGEIQEHVRQQGLGIVSCEFGDLPPSLIPLCTSTNLAAVIEVFSTTKTSQESETRDFSRCRDLLPELVAAVKQGEVYHWRPITLLAQKSS